MIEKQPAVPPVAATDIGRAYAGAAGQCVPHIVDGARVGGSDLAVDPRDVGEVSRHGGAWRHLAHPGNRPA